jgi:hypothetical protein
MNWLERARREIGGSGRQPTAISAEGIPTAAMAVLDAGPREGPAATIGSNGSALSARIQVSEAMREAFEERAAIMEFDGGLSHEDAERIAWTLIVKPRRLH